MVVRSGDYAVARGAYSSPSTRSAALPPPPELLAYKRARGTVRTRGWTIDRWTGTDLTTPPSLMSSPEEERTEEEEEEEEGRWGGCSSRSNRFGHANAAATTTTIPPPSFDFNQVLNTSIVAPPERFLTPSLLPLYRIELRNG